MRLPWAPLLILLLSLPAAAGVPDRVVVITDSHGIGGFGEGLEAWLQGRPLTRYDFFASGASAPRQWTSTRFKTPCGYHQGSDTVPRKKRACSEQATPHLSELWAAQPSGTSKERRITIIAHGTNYPINGRASEVAATKSLLEAAFAAGEVCVWIGPPTMTRSPAYDAEGVAYKYRIIEDGIAAVAKATGRRCALIDSRPLSSYPRLGGDGIHYHWLATKDPDSRAQAPKWAAAVVGKLDALLR